MDGSDASNEGQTEADILVTAVEGGRPLFHIVCCSPVAPTVAHLAFAQFSRLHPWAYRVEEAARRTGHGAFRTRGLPRAVEVTWKACVRTTGNPS